MQGASLPYHADQGRSGQIISDQIRSDQTRSPFQDLARPFGRSGESQFNSLTFFLLSFLVRVFLATTTKTIKKLSHNARGKSDTKGRIFQNYGT